MNHILCEYFCTPAQCHYHSALNVIMINYDNDLSHSSELIRNQTLKFLSKTLPVLKGDDTLPKVTQIIPDESVDTLEDNG